MRHANCSINKLEVFIRCYSTHSSKFFGEVFGCIHEKGLLSSWFKIYSEMFSFPSFLVEVFISNFWCFILRFFLPSSDISTLLFCHVIYIYRTVYCAGISNSTIKEIFFWLLLTKCNQRRHQWKWNTGNVWRVRLFKSRLCSIGFKLAFPFEAIQLPKYITSTYLLNIHCPNTHPS